jgi:hypothetical protein
MKATFKEIQRMIETAIYQAKCLNTLASLSILLITSLMALLAASALDSGTQEVKNLAVAPEY